MSARSAMCLGRLAASALVALVAAACGDPVSAEPTTTASSPLIGGEPTREDPAVVALVASELTFCTGTLVGPQLVLTAAHCVEDAPRGLLEVAFGSGADGELSNRVVVEEAAIHPAYDRDAPGADLALLRLAQRAPADIEPRELVSRAEPEPRRGERVRHVGFGLSDAATGAGMGVKRTGVHEIQEVSPGEISTGAEGARTCFGDSGGPALRAVDGGAERLVGVVSRAAPGDRDCTGARTWDTRIDVHRDWIDAQTAAWLAPDPPDPPDPAGRAGCSVGVARAPAPLPGLLIGAILAAAFVRRSGLGTTDRRPSRRPDPRRPRGRSRSCGDGRGGS